MMNTMLNTRLKFRKNQKGMTLIELLAVVVILGIVAAIAIPAIGNVVENSRTKADAATTALVTDAILRYVMTTDPAPTSPFSDDIAKLDDLGIMSTVPSWNGTAPGTKFTATFNTTKKIWEVTYGN